MNKTFLTSLAVVLPMVACTNADDLQAGQEVMAPEVVAQSNVPIRYAPVFIKELLVEPEEISPTRGSIDVSNFTIANVGMFCLAKARLPGITVSPSWSGLSKNETLKQLSVWQNNARATFSGRDGKVADIILNTDDGDVPNALGAPSTRMVPAFYPQNEWFSYGFVAYHPRTEYIQYNYSSITAYIVLNGRDNVFYSIASEPRVSAGTNYDALAFSGTYYKKIAEEEPDEGISIYPYFAVEHLTSRLNFQFQLNAMPSFNVHVEKVEFDNFPCIMQLGLAKRVNGKMLSNISKNYPFVRNDSIYRIALKLPELFPGISEPFGHFELYEKDGVSISGLKDSDGNYKYNLSTERTRVGDCIFIPPVYKSHTRSTIKLFVTVADDAGNKYRNVSAVNLVAPAKGWEKGKQYTFTIQLNPPVLSGNSVQITDWSMDDPIDINGESIGWSKVEE